MRTELFWMHGRGICGEGLGRRNFAAWFNNVHLLVLPCTCVQVVWIWFLWVWIVAPMHDPEERIPSAEDLLLLNSGRFLPWANSYLLEILRPKNWNLIPPRNSGKFYSSLIETKSEFFPAECFSILLWKKVFPFFYWEVFPLHQPHSPFRSAHSDKFQLSEYF